MTELIGKVDQNFIFDANTIRVFGDINNLYFVAKDVCTVLGIGNVSHAMKKIPEKWKGITKSDINSKGQEQLFLTEPGLYRLIMRSNKPNAVKFQEWVCEEVLPSIRKTGMYNIEQLHQQLEDKEKKIGDLQASLLQEQSDVINTKKSLTRIQRKFTHRHKFDGNPCVYILQDPDCKYQKFKVGYTKDINQRLKTNRTMVPNIKVRAIFYTIHHELFEKCILTRYREQLEEPSHEWILETFDKLFQTCKDIDKINYFASIAEPNLWRYNLEDPPEDSPEDSPEDTINEKCSDKDETSSTDKEDSSNKTSVQKTPINSCPTKPRRKDPNSVPTHQNTMDEDLTRFLPTRILRHEYKQKTIEAPDEKRFCNAFCQCYQPLSTFTIRSNYHLTICIFCERMLDIAKIRTESGVLTEKEIRADPSILKISDDEQVCRKCNQILKKTDFPEKRRQCKTCRNSMRSKHGEKFDLVIDQEVSQIKQLSGNDLNLKLNKYVKIELHKIMTYLEIGRKYNDKKADCIRKITEKIS